VEALLNFFFLLRQISDETAGREIGAFKGPTPMAADAAKWMIIR
jgi:hypothetical protein